MAWAAGPTQERGMEGGMNERSQDRSDQEGFGGGGEKKKKAAGLAPQSNPEPSKY